jgi:hypothetical protein
VSKDFSEELRAADPVGHEAGLSATEVESMHRAIVEAATHTRDAGSWSPRPALLTMALAFILALGVFIATMFEPAREEWPQPQADEQRQLQFETPGGTRVVWVLNSHLDL